MSTAPAPGPAAPPAPRTAWLGVAVLALPTLALATDLSVLFLAVPRLAADLAPSNAQMLWILDIYGFMIAGFLIIMGTLGDRIGRRRLLLTGAGAFAAASVVAAYAPNATALIAARAVLGIAGATLMPSALGLIGSMFADQRQRALAIAVWMSSFMAGVALGPVLGGALLEWFWWGSVFLANVVPIAVLLVAGPLLLPEHRDARAGRLDLVSTGLALATILPVVYALKAWANDGSGGAVPVALLVGVGVGTTFVRRQRRLPDPLLDLHLFGERTFSTALGVTLVASATVAGLSLFLTQHLQLVLGLSPLQTALWGVPPALCVLVGSMLAPGLVGRFGAGPVVAGALGLAAAGLVALTQVGPGWGLAPLMVAFVVAFLGAGPVGAVTTELAVGSAPPEKAGSASSVSETSGELGIALGVAVLGTIGTFVYRRSVAGALPDGLPADVAAAARDTLAGAVAAAADLPTRLADAVVAPAGRAFLDGLSTVAGVQAVVLAVAAVVTARMLRRSAPVAAPPAVDPAAWGQAFDRLEAHLARTTGGGAARA